MTKHKVERPLILVPGILESTLTFKKTIIWPLTSSRVPNYIDLKKLLSDLGTNIPKRMDDKSSVVAKDLLPGVFDNIIRAIKKWGYKLESNFWVFPYDWRQSNEISGQMLAKFIDNKIDGNCDGVDIVCHSMGGFVTRSACKQNAPIKRIAYIATPHFGSPLSYFELNPEIRNVGFSDFYEKAAISDKLRIIVSGHTGFEKKMNDLYRKWPSAYELMPDDSYLTNRPMIYSDGQAILGINKTYLENEWKLPPDMQRKVIKAMKFKDSLGQLHGNHDDTLVIYSNTLETLDTVGYSSTGITIEANPTFHFSPPFDNNQHGDSIVVTDSAKGSMSGKLTYKHKSIRNVVHTALPDNDEAIQEIKKFLNPQ